MSTTTNGNGNDNNGNDTTTTTTIAPLESSATETEQPNFIDRRALARSTPPIPCYKVERLPPKAGTDPTTLYGDELPHVVRNKTATLVSKLEIPPRDARSWRVPAGCLWRIVCTHGPQVADMNCWSLHDVRETFYSSKTRQIHATHLQAGHSLWSCFPYLRRMATITRETIEYGFDEDGAGVHDVIGSRCDPYTHHYMMSTTNDGGGGGGDNDDNDHADRCCHSNLTRQAIQDNMKEEHVHDVLNVFMCTGFTKDTHQYFTKPSPVQVGDYIEFLAEIDLLVSASTCPQGDVSIACGSTEEEEEEEPKVFPLGVEIYKLPPEWLEDRGWHPSVINGYKGNHGMPPK